MLPTTVLATAGLHHLRLLVTTGTARVATTTRHPGPAAGMQKTCCGTAKSVLIPTTFVAEATPRLLK